MVAGGWAEMRPEVTVGAGDAFDFYSKDMGDTKSYYYYAYDFRSACVHAQTLFPIWGFGNAILRNGPLFSKAADSTSLVQLNGANQYVVFPPSLADIVNIRVKVRFMVAASKVQTLFALGSRTNGAFSAVLDGEDKCRVVVARAKTGETFQSAPMNVVRGTWTTLTAQWTSPSNVAVQLNSAASVNLTVACTMNDLVAPNDWTDANAVYLGRGTAATLQDCFAGSVAFFGVGFCDDTSGWL